MSEAGTYLVSTLLTANSRLPIPAGAWVSVMARGGGPYPLVVTLEGDSGVQSVYLSGPARWRWPAGGTLSAPVDCYVTAASRAELLPDGASIAGQAPSASTQYTAAQSSTANIPSAPTDGAALGGRRLCRAIVSAAAAQTITACTVVWWVYNETLGRWAESPTQDSPPTGRRDVATPDQFVGAAGRVFAEVRNATASGAGALTVTLEVM